LFVCLFFLFFFFAADAEEEEEAAMLESTKFAFGSSRATEFSSALVADASLPQGTWALPRQSLMKTWLVENDGTKAWPANTRVVLVSGDHLTNSRDVYAVNPAAVGQTVEVNTIVDTPAKPGKYRALYSLIASGKHFGEKLCVELIVADDSEEVWHALSLRMGVVYQCQS
jgi:hypothetical protein